MIVAFSIGSKCALMLPREYLNPQVTPAKGLIVNKLVDNKRLILVEEVWQFKGLKSSPLSEMCMPTGNIRQVNWGWQEVPELLEEGSYLMVPADPHRLMEPSINTLEAMIKKSILDFKKVKGSI